MQSHRATKTVTPKRAYPDKRKPAEGKVDFPFMRITYGRTVKVLAILIGEDCVGRAAAGDRRFRETGLTPEWITEQVVALCPWFPKKYKEVTGLELKPNILYSRWHKSVYKTGPKGKSRVSGDSPEHPLNHPRLRPILAKVEAAWKKNRPIPYLDACRMGGV